MVNFYVKLIRLGRMELSDVPERWREAVEQALNNENGGYEKSWKTTKNGLSASALCSPRGWGYFMCR